MGNPKWCQNLRFISKSVNNLLDLLFGCLIINALQLKVQVPLPPNNFISLKTSVQ
jgi:hypothetical protein